MFGGDLDDVFRPADPDVMADRLEGWQREFNKQVDAFDRMQQAAAGLRVTETAVNGGLRVTVDATGQVVEIVTNDELESLGTKEIGPAVLACIRRAQQKLREGFAEKAKETLGDDPLGAQLTEQFSERFATPEKAAPVRAKKPVDEDDSESPKVWED